MAAAIVQFNSAFNDASGTTLGIAQGTNPGVDSFNWAIGNSVDATMTVADTGANTYTERGTVIEAGISRRQRHFTAPVGIGGANTVTVTFGASVAGRSVTVVEVSGVNAYDAQGTATDTGNHPTDSASVTNSVQPAIALACCIDLQGGSPGVGSGYTNIGQFEPISGSATGARLVYKLLTTTASQSVNFANTPLNRTTTTFVILDETSGAPTVDQEGARFGVDDGSESAHTWAAAQDANVTAPLSANLLVRLLVNATGDPASVAYTLRSQKNGSGGYTAVPIVASTKTRPVIEAGDCTISGSNTAEATWAVSHPAAATGDLLIFYAAWDDSTSVTDVTEPAGPNGETLTEINATPVTDSSTETKAKAWYCVATGAWTASTRTFTPSASESWSASVIKVLAGEFDGTTPIGAIGTSSATTTTDTTVDSPAFTAGSTDGSGAIVWCAGVDTDPLSATPPTGWAIVQNQDLGAVAHGVAVRTADVTNSESIASATWAIAGDSWTSIAFVIRAPTTTNQLYISPSSNITAGGEATTARLTAPSGKSTSDFVTGRRWDDENGTDTTDITTDDYTEVEWCVQAQSPAVDGNYFDFRVYAGAAALATYTVTPRWTLGAGGANAALTGVAGTGAVGSLAIAAIKALTGNAGTAAVGSLTPSIAIAVAISGVTATGAVGTLAASASKALTGNAGTGGVGTLSPAAVVPLSGLSATGAVGTLTPTLAVVVALSGNAGTAAAGALGVAAVAALAGNSGTGAAGTLAASVVRAAVGNAAAGAAGGLAAGASAALTGNASTGALGALAPRASVLLSGNAATGAVGTLTPTTATVVPLTGVSASGGVGAVSAVVTTALSGNAAVGAVGALAPSSAGSVQLTGNAGAGGVGSFGATVALVVPGNAATGSPGTLAASAVRALSGNSATGAAGSVAAAVQAPLSGVAATGATGLLSPSSAGSVQISGNAATGQVGAFGVTVARAMSGNAATGAPGSVATSAIVAPTGNAATGAVGAPGVAVSVALTGNAGAGAVGPVTPSITGSSVALTGNAAAGSVGSFGVVISRALTGNAATCAPGSVTAAAIAALSGVGAPGAVGSFQAFLQVALSGVAGAGAVGSVAVALPADAIASDRYTLRADPRATAASAPDRITTNNAGPRITEITP